MGVIILQGTSGSGKSTYAERLMHAFVAQGGGSAVIVSTDHFFTKTGTYQFDSNKLGEAHAACFRHFIEALQSGVKLVIVDNTNTRATEIAPYMLGAAAYGYTAVIHRLNCDPAVAAARTIHRVPTSIVTSMSRRIRSERLPPYWHVIDVAV